MGLRLLASFPLAVLMIAVLLVSASSYVSAIETRQDSNPNLVLRLDRAESFCEVMIREIRAISRLATTCNLDLQCLGSPILCPITLDRKQERKYSSLRAQFERQCAASYSLGDEAMGDFRNDLEFCGAGSGGFESEAPIRSSEPKTFVF